VPTTYIASDCYVVKKLVDTLEATRNLDLGLGVPLNFGRSEHTASKKIWGTALDESGRFQPVDLE